MARLKRRQIKASDVVAEAVRIASEAREAAVVIDWSVSAMTPLEGEIRIKLIHQIELEEFANQRSTHRPLSWVAMRIRQRLAELIETIPDGCEYIGTDLQVADRKWLAFYKAELKKETAARQAALRATAEGESEST